ncbi:hypothetical protein AJ80_04654 [Polytolypa hystricis UAMH7299]|uniref:Arf-GAP domain-containing protein n=1 Tax=Polytolypa hystricis (strain UAMH7299) TaxID=1447883 RepID=A0A2B7Y9V0_POLH7|nr:hypothetical protein AJ80_04654 [Polytolypa hystricis UAMH7299]
MSSSLSKREQARNERALQELIKTAPGNDRCADCQARNPGWASWNLGIFLCMRCAALHRKLGTHISKVKSLSMDSWTSDQVNIMKKNGNNAVNKVYNPRNVKPPIPIDVDEADSAMERFIRQKYEARVLEDGRPKPPSRQDPSYTTPKASQDSPPPPPLPPKTGRRFGFGLRSVSAAYPFSSSDRQSSRDETHNSHLHHTANKHSRVIGANVDGRNDSFESKLQILRDMGFPDEKRNATVLKGVSGNLEKAIESLVRLGEGIAGPRSRSRTPVPISTPTSAHYPESISSSRSAVSSNPFDNLDNAPPRPTAGITINRTPPQTSGNQETVNRPASTNPFDFPVSQPSSTVHLEQSFQQLQVSQPLFPNITGGYPSQQGQMSYLRQQQSMTPPVGLSSQQGLAASPVSLNGSYNPFFQPAQPVQNGVASAQFPTQAQTMSPSNPFFGQTVPQNQNTAPPQLQASQTFDLASPAQPQMPAPQRYNTMPALSSTSPFLQVQQQQLQLLQQQQQQQLQLQQQQQAPYNPFFSAPQIQSSNLYQGQIPNQYQQQFLTPQQTGRMDKTSILALYNFSQPPPTIPEQPQAQQQQQHPPVNDLTATQPQATQNNTLSPQLNPPSFDTSAVGSRNPFGPPQPHPGPSTQNPFPAAPGMPPTKPPMASNSFQRAHMSQESVDIGGMQSGRHSPDVFASLSARYVR